MHFDKDLIAASATPLVLGILADGESYGYAILKQVNELSEGRMTWADGMLYPLLHRLERLGYVEANWRTAPNGRRRKHYAITLAGREALAERHRQWDVVAEALARLRLEPMSPVRPVVEGKRTTLDRLRQRIVPPSVTLGGAAA